MSSNCFHDNNNRNVAAGNRKGKKNLKKDSKEAIFPKDQDDDDDASQNSLDDLHEIAGSKSIFSKRKRTRTRYREQMEYQLLEAELVKKSALIERLEGEKRMLLIHINGLYQQLQGGGIQQPGNEDLSKSTASSISEAKFLLMADANGQYIPTIHIHHSTNKSV